MAKFQDTTDYIRRNRMASKKRILKKLVNDRNMQASKFESDLRMAKKLAAEDEALEALSPTARKKAMSDKAKARQRKEIARKAQAKDKPDFDKAIARVKGMALTDAARNKKLIEVYKKYGRKAPISLVKPVGKKGGGKVAISKKKGGKMKSKGYNSGGKVKQEKALELKKKAGSKTTQNKKKRTKDNDLFGMLSGLGYQKGTMPGDTFKAGGKIKSKGYKAGGKMKSKGYKAGGKMKNNSQSGHNRLY